MTANRTDADLPNQPEHALLRELRALDLDPENFVVFGSAPLLAHGLRTDIHDLDVLARGSAWQEVWDRGEPAHGDVTGDDVREFADGRIQFSRQWISGDYDTDTLIDEAEVVDDLRFARLEEVLRYKEKLDRPKDQCDIAALRKHLGHQVAVPTGCAR